MNGSGTLICAAAAVNAVMNSADAKRIAVLDSLREASVFTSVVEVMAGFIEAKLYYRLSPENEEVLIGQRLSLEDA